VKRGGKGSCAGGAKPPYTQISVRLFDNIFKNDCIYAAIKLGWLGSAFVE